MASTVSLEEVKKIISFPFKGEKWAVKNLIGAALTLGNYIIPIVTLLPVLGYAARIMKRIIADDEDPALPEWDDWGNLFLDGLKMFAVMLIYELPAILIMFIGCGVMLFPIFSVSTTSYSHMLPDTFLLTTTLFSFGGMALMMVGIIILIFAMLLLPPALGNMIAKGSLGAAFQIKDWWPVFKANLTGYLLSIILLVGLYFMLIYVSEFLLFTVILCILLPFLLSFIGFFILMVMMALFAIAYRDGTRKLAEAN